MTLEKAARAIDRVVPVGVEDGVQEGVFGVPIPLLVALREALDGGDAWRAHCLGCGGSLPLGEPVTRCCGRQGCAGRVATPVWGERHEPEEVGP